MTVAPALEAEAETLERALEAADETEEASEEADAPEPVQISFFDVDLLNKTYQQHHSIVS